MKNSKKPYSYSQSGGKRYKEWWESDWDRWSDFETFPDPSTGRSTGISPGFGGSWSSEDIRLAVALRAARSMVSVLDTNSKEKMRVNFLTPDSEAIAATAIGKGQIFISAAPVVDYPDDMNQAIRCINGETFHEVGHSVGTRKRQPFFPKPGETSNDEVTKAVINILEDNLIEAEQVELNPGFKKYLTSTMQWIEEMDKAQNPGLLPWDLSSAEDRTGHLVQLLRYKETTEKWKTIPAETQDALEQIQADYLTSRDSEKKNLILAALGILLQNAAPSTPKPKDGEGENDGEDDGQGTQQGEGEGEGTEGDGTEKQRQIGGLQGARCYGNGTFVLSREQAERVANLVDQDVEYDEATSTVITRPIVQAPQPAKRTPEVSKLVAEIRARPTQFSKPASLQKAGTVDANQLHRIFFDPADLRVFHKPVIAGKTWARIYLLADNSGSMGYEELKVVYDCALMMIHAFKDMKVATKVYGYTDHSQGHQIYRIWEPGDPLERLPVLYETERGGTPTGEALRWTVDRILKDSMGPEEKKLIIVLTDGSPNHPELVRSVVTDGKRKGVAVLEIAINTFSEEHQRMMFGKNFIRYQYGGSSQTSKLAKWLSANM